MTLPSTYCNEKEQAAVKAIFDRLPSEASLADGFAALAHLDAFALEQIKKLAYTSGTRRPFLVACSLGCQTVHGLDRVLADPHADSVVKFWANEVKMSLMREEVATHWRRIDHQSAAGERDVNAELFGFGLLSTFIGQNDLATVSLRDSYTT